MLPSQSQPHHLSTPFHRRAPPSTTTSRRLKLISASHHQTIPEKPNDAVSTTLRTHNARSTALLLHHLSPQNHENPDPENQESRLPLLNKQDRDKLLEIALLSKRTPQFPGSIHTNSSLPRAQSVLRGERSSLDYYDDEVDDDMLVKALEIRRRVTREVFKEAIKRGKFGITYCENLVSEASEFIDYVMIEAVGMKKLP